MKKISILFSLVLLASSCVEQMEEPESAKIAGMWAIVDDNDFTTKYLEFEHGNVKEHVSEQVAYYVADKSVWACPEGGFKQLSPYRYFLVDGTLHYGSNRHKMRVEGETMSLGDMKCRLVESICHEYYSTINVFNPTQSFAFNGGGVEWAYSITNPVEGFTLKATTPEWVSDLRVTADKISFTIPHTTTTRTGTITLSYPSAEDIELSITQRAAEINLDKTSVTLDYAASSSSFTYSIPDPQDGYTLNVEASHDWIIDIKDNASSISFSVKENNSGSTRAGKIILTYGGISREYVVTQTYSATSIAFTPTSGSHDYTSGAYNFKYSISNPREGQEASVSTSDTWITGVMDNNGTVSYTVSRNTTGSSRSGKITVKYGDLSKTFTITQSAASLTLSSSSATCTYASATKSFNLTISNRQSDLAVSVQSDVSWITGVSESNGSVSYTIAENNSGSSRTGKITVTYAGVSKEFVVTQTYSATSIVFTPTSASHDYTSGAYNFKYSISNPREGQEASVSTSDTWITGVMDNNGTVSYTVSRNTTGSSRSGKITVKYGDLSKTFTITQSAASLTLSSSSATCTYASATKSFNLTISNRQSDLAVSVQSDVSWITGVSESNGSVSYTIAENNSGSSRTGKITVTYAGVSKEFVVTQTYSATSIVFTPTSTSHDYTSGTYNFKYTISNPREGQKAAVSTSDTWITGVTDSGGTVSYMVSTNTTGSSRSAKITVKYGDLFKIFTITQSAASLTLSSSSATCTYASATKSFNLTISNRQSDLAVSVQSDVSWITGVSESNGSVSYTIAENNSGSSRTGKITVTYAGVSKEFNVTQEKKLVNLSVSGTANCYVVSETGSYFFKSVKGNSSTSVGSVSSVVVLWESFGTSTTPSVGDLVKSVSYKDGNIYFDTATTFREGNAVIAAKNSSGTILWSWHIWFTDAPQGHKYYNNAGTMMDRNLGATSATPGDVGALGLLYQWGRKDPFLGSSSISISTTVAESTITWPSEVKSYSSNGTIEYATAHPTTFITENSRNYDWYYTVDSSTENTRWTTSEDSKSIYDPCPVGWRVPDGGANGVWSKAWGSSCGSYDSTNEGMNFSGTFGSDQTIWYPASGFRSDGDGSLDEVGMHGRYWSASPIGYCAYGMYFYQYGGESPSNSIGRANGLSVRCVRE